MKTVRLIKHYKLEPPFDQKETITPDLYQSLSQGNIDPDIHTDIESYLSKHFSPHEFDDFTIVLSSPSRRTINTANELINNFNLNARLVVNENLQEIRWNPSLGPGRIKRFINDKGPLGIKATWDKYHEMEAELQKYPDENILCVTHSFVIQTSFQYFVEGKRDWQTVTVEDIQSSLLADYLEGFTVNLS